MKVYLPIIILLIIPNKSFSQNLSLEGENKELLLKNIIAQSSYNNHKVHGNGINVAIARITTSSNTANLSKSVYGDNLIGFFPLGINNSGIGFGLSYERLLGKKSKLSLYVPITAGFTLENLFASGSNYTGLSWGDQTSYSCYIMPGAKIYPTGAKGKIRYGVGPALSLRFGSKSVSYSTYPPNSAPSRISY